MRTKNLLELNTKKGEWEEVDRGKYKKKGKKFHKYTEAEAKTEMKDIFMYTMAEVYNDYVAEEGGQPSFNKFIDWINSKYAE